MSGSVGNHHKIEDLCDTVARQEPGQQDVGIRKIDLPVPRLVQDGLQREHASALVVQQRCEDAWAVEPRPAQEINGSLECHQRDCAEVADDAVVFNRLSQQTPLPVVQDFVITRL